MRRLEISLFLLVWIFFIPISHRASEFLLSSVSLDEGLSQTTVRAMLRDSHDYLWIGTKIGLNRYDGGKMTSFFYDSRDINTIPDNDVVDLFEDADGNVWVVCDKGVAVYDRTTGRFNRKEISGHPLRIRSHLKSKDGIILGGGGHVYFYNYDNKEITPIKAEGGSDRFYNRIHEWGNGHYILATRWDGLWRYDSTNEKIDRFEISGEPNIMASHVDKDGNLWMSPYGDGLKCYDRTGRMIYEAGMDVLGSDIVLDILGEGDTLWIATDGAGLHTIDTRTREVRPVRSNNERNFRGLRSVTKLYRDDYGYIYAGTVRDGMVCITETPMTTFSELPGADAMAVTAVFADGNKIWIGIDGGGVVMYEPDKGDLFTSIPETSQMKVTSIEAYDNNNLLLSTFDNGLYTLDKRTGTVSRAPEMFDEIVNKNSKKALPLDLRRLPGNRMAVMTDRLYVCDIDNGTSREIAPSTSITHLNEFYTDINGMLCFSDGEILRFDLATNKFETLVTLNERPITCAVYDGNRNIYIGTSAGIRKFDTISGAITNMDNPALLPLRPTALVYDNGRLWIAADGAVYMKNFDTGELSKFDRYDGVAPNEFIYKSKLATPTHIYFGGVNGLLKIDRSAVPEFLSREKKRIPKVTDAEIDGNILMPYNDKAVFDIPYGMSHVNMRVIGGDTYPLREPQFKFFVRTSGRDIPLESSGNKFMLTHLADGGHYEVFASYIMTDGSWSIPECVAVINVMLPWWKTTWALCCYILIILILIVMAVVYIVRRRRRVIARRLDEIKRKSLESEIGFLADINHELRTPLTLIYARLKSLIVRLQGREPDKEKILSELDNIYNSAQRMRDIMNTSVDQWVENDIPSGGSPMIDVEDSENISNIDSSSVDTSDMTILIAEEDSDLSSFMTDYLKKLFGKVVAVPDGKDAITEIKNTNPDLIIIDSHLRGMNGIELCQHIKQLSEYNHIPIILLTTRVEDKALRSGHDLGADVYITKPFDMSQIVNCCMNVLRTFDRVKQRYKGKAADILQRDNYNNEAETFLLKIKEVIELNISQPGFGVDIIVEKMFMSRSSLYTKFKELTGQSLGAYIEDYRMTRAKEMLVTTDMTMNEISDALGFSTQRYFSTFFKKNTAMSPTKYRENYKTESKLT